MLTLCNSKDGTDMHYWTIGTIDNRLDAWRAFVTYLTLMTQVRGEEAESRGKQGLQLSGGIVMMEEDRGLTKVHRQHRTSSRARTFYLNIPYLPYLPYLTVPKSEKTKGGATDDRWPGPMLDQRWAITSCLGSALMQSRSALILLRIVSLVLPSLGACQSRTKLR